MGTKAGGTTKKAGSKTQVKARAKGGVKDRSKNRASRSKMQISRTSRTKNRTKSRAQKSSTGKSTASTHKSKSSLSFQRFLGISLGGARSERTAVVVLDYFSSHKKLVLTKISDRFKSENGASSDLKLHDFVGEYKQELRSIGLDVPLSLPKCFRCNLKCPGFEVCTETEIRWMWKASLSQGQDQEQDQEDDHYSPKPFRTFTPYTRRCAEVHWSKELKGAWALGDALGANGAPLLARARYLTRRWKHKVIEVIPRLSLWRWGEKNRVSLLQIRNYRHPVNGADAREYLLKQMVDKLDLFIYDQDRNELIDHLPAFEALLIALTAFWDQHKQCEKPPKGFPRSEGWISVPQF